MTPDRLVELERVLQFLEETLATKGFPDYDRAVNGLQVEGPDRISRVGAAVDASVEVVEAAVERGIDLLLVHHGLFWGGSHPITGPLYRKIGPLVKSGIALYSAHLPLDAHPEVGNAAVLIRALGLEPADRFARYESVDLGFVTHVEEDRRALRERVAKVVGGPVRLIEGGPLDSRRVGVVTGGGASFLREAAERGLDTLLTGEGAHHTYMEAMELGVNVLYAGHYATETWGVKALATKLAAELDLEWEFLDFPSGL